MSLRLALYAAIAAGLLFVGWRIVDLVATGRVSKATEIYNQENRDAADAVSAARARVRDCHARGLSWDRAAGECIRAVPQPRQ